jgi:DNA-binding winged helix-turn-helix (wHTH) protein
MLAGVRTSFAGTEIFADAAAPFALVLTGSGVSRQEIIERLWGKDVFLDTGHGINTAIRKIRTALREDVERPRFIQTVSGKGYRFVYRARAHLQVRRF